MAFEITNVWPLLVKRLEAGGRTTNEELASLIRLNSSPPPSVMLIIADALEGKSKPGRPHKGVSDDLRNPVKLAALVYKMKRAKRKLERDNWRGTAKDDLEQVAEAQGVDLEKLVTEVRRAKPKRSKK